MPGELLREARANEQLLTAPFSIPAKLVSRRRIAALLVLVVAIFLGVSVCVTAEPRLLIRFG